MNTHPNENDIKRSLISLLEEARDLIKEYSNSEDGCHLTYLLNKLGTLLRIAKGDNMSSWQFRKESSVYIPLCRLQEIGVDIKGEEDEDVELAILYNCTGYHQSAIMNLANGDPGYPEEGDDCREIITVSYRKDDEYVKIPKEVWSKIEDYITEQIYKEALKPPDQEPDYEDEDL
jgi:hypothetical protein